MTLLAVRADLAARAPDVAVATLTLSDEGLARLDTIGAGPSH